MKNPTSSTPELLRVLVELARELPPNTLNALACELEAGRGEVNLGRFTATQTTKGQLRKLEALCVAQPQLNPNAIALALRAAMEMATVVSAEHRTEIAWTGPATEAVHLRRVDQVIYEMLEGAKEEIVLITYAAYKAERVRDLLGAATQNGVRVQLVIELAEESGGKISFDALHALREAVPAAQIYYWPLDRRTRGASGAYGAMHAKCLVVDRKRAIVSSANLTDYALEVNMELGLIAERAIASRLAEHFDQLIVRGDLVHAP